MKMQAIFYSLNWSQKHIFSTGFQLNTQSNRFAEFNRKNKYEFIWCVKEPNCKDEPSNSIQFAFQFFQHYEFLCSPHKKMKCQLNVYYKNEIDWKRNKKVTKIKRAKEKKFYKRIEYFDLIAVLGGFRCAYTCISIFELITMNLQVELMLISIFFMQIFFRAHIFCPF